MGVANQTEQTMSPRRRENRAVLVGALREILLTEGLSGMTFEKVAEKAGMTRKSVYNHFSTRNGLFEVLMNDIGARAGFQGMAAIWENQDPQDLITAYFTELCRGWDADRDMFRLMVGLSAADPELGAAVLQRVERVKFGANALADRLANSPGLAQGWTEDKAAKSIFALSVFTTYDALKGGSGNQEETVAALCEMAKAPFNF